MLLLWTQRRGQPVCGEGAWRSEPGCGKGWHPACVRALRPQKHGGPGVGVAWSRDTELYCVRNQIQRPQRPFPTPVFYCLRKSKGLGFPGGAVVGNLPANAGDTSSSPGLGRSHMPWSDSAREPQLLSLRVWSLCSATREAAIMRGPRTAMKSGPRLPRLEEALAQKRTPNTAINR